MNCDQARTELIAYLKSELSTARQKSLEEHLARCPECRQELEGARRLLAWTEAASQDAVVKRVSEIIDGAIDAGATDVHLEPQGDGGMGVRYRVDGVLYEEGHVESVQRYGVVARLKMLSEMTVSETSIPQDGIFRWTHREQEYNIRMSAMPYVYGEGLVLRLLVRSVWLPDWDKLGLYDDQIADVKRLIHQPNGLVLIAGPTGSGKTTTGYMMMKEIDSSHLKVVTIEDPVEVILKGIDQAQVNRSAGFTYPKAIQAFMRQDPDVLYVGEINDQETGNICVKAAATGHLVISTIFNLTAADAVKLLIDLCTHKHLVAFTLIGVIAQRLARKVCEGCGDLYEPNLDDPAIRFLGITADDLAKHTIRSGKGCEKCRNTGYHGRTAIFEVLTVDRDLSRLIGEQASVEELTRAAQAKGFMTIREDAKRKVLAGITTPDEAMRVLLD